MNRESYEGITLGYGSWAVDEYGSNHYFITDTFGEVWHDSEEYDATANFICITP